MSARLPRTPTRGDTAAVVRRLMDEATRCRLLPQGAEPDPVLQSLFEGFAAEIAALRLDLDHSLEENRRNLLAHFLGLGYRRQPSQALAGVSMEQPGGIDERLDLRGHSTRMPTEETLTFRLPGSLRLPRMSIGGAAYTGPRGLVLLDADPKAPQRTLEPVHVGEIDSPGPPTFHIGLRGTPPRAGELLTLAFIPPQESHFRLYPQHSRDLSDYRRWICGSSLHAAGGVLAPPRRLDELVAEESLDSAVSDRLPTRRAAFRVLLEQHVYADLIFGWSGPLTDILAVGPPPEQLLRQAQQLCPDSARAWGSDLRWVSLRLAGLPGDDPLRLFHRIAVNVVPILAYEILEPDRQNVSMGNVSPITGVLPVPLTPETHAILQDNDWLIDRVESTGEIFPHVHEHPDPDGYWYGLLSDWCSSTLYVHLPAVRPRSIGPIDLYLGRLSGGRANGAVLDPYPYNRGEFPGLDVLWQLTEFVGGTEGHGGDTEIPWEGIGSFLRTRDRLVTRWDYEGFVRRFDPRISSCEFRNVALHRDGRFVPGVAIVVQFDLSVGLTREDMAVSVLSLQREVNRRAALGTHVDIRLDGPAPGTGGAR